MACFPGLAAAEENSGIQYETDVPSVPNGDSNIPSKKKAGDTSPSDGSNAEANESNTPGGVGSGDDESGTGGGATTNQGNQGPGGGGDKAANGSKPAGDVSGGKKLATSPSPTAATSDDSGSSPLVPILIAVAVLAAISIGAYYYRQRRQGPDSTVAPPAS